MKSLTIILLILFSIFQTMGQGLIKLSRNNAMSNVFAITAEGGVTLGVTDYSTLKINYTGKGSLEYYFPSSANGNIGLRVFGQTGFIYGRGAPPTSGNPTNQLSTKFDLYGGGLVYLLSLGDAVYPWVGFGVSNLWYYPKDGNGNRLPNYSAGNYSLHTLAYNGDIGVKIIISKNMSFNISGGIIIASNDFLDDIKTGPSNDLLYTASVGFSYYFGRDIDSDGDGVPDSKDVCPNTPPRVNVDASGCPVDSDGDGVPDYLDKCPSTPANVKVDAAGCPLDSDADGVPDYLDKCADTPSKVRVDSEGCPLDSDADGVPDYLDKCPNTLAGVQVDADGCPIKKDSVVVVKSIEPIVLSGDANFESGKSELLPTAYAILDSLVRTMKSHPEYKWEIAGFTDAVGSDKYNQKLSERRAQSIADYLLGKGVDRNNLTIVGYGEERPISTNKTAEGRAMNRRVEIKLLSR